MNTAMNTPINFLIVALLMGILGILFDAQWGDNSPPLAPPPAQQKYHEENYMLKDGTPCTLVHAGGGHTRTMAITCEYNI